MRNDLMEVRGDVADAVMAQQVALAESIAEAPRWKGLLEGLSGMRKVTTAVMLENLKRHIDQMDETTRSVSIGTFDKYAFPLVRTIFPNLIATEIVSVQPMTGPASMVFFFDFVYGTTKGKITKGDKVIGSATTPGPFDSTYTSETVANEQFATGDGDTAPPSFAAFKFTPVRAGSVYITDGSQVVRDDGNGNLVGDASAGTINYSTGQVAGLVFTGAVTNAVAVLATYEYDSENVADATTIPELDILLTSSPVISKPRKLRARWSLEAANNMRALYGLDAEVELVTAVAEQVKFEIDREIITDIGNLVGSATTQAAFDATPPSNISYTEHKLRFIDSVNALGNKIFKATRRAQPNWMIMGLNVANIVETLPGWRSLPENTSSGIRHAGNLNGRWEVYKDPYGDAPLTDNSYLMGYRGTSFLDTGYVYAPFIPLYTTPTVILDDFIARKGMATQYGKKAINHRFYGKGSISNPQV